MKSHPPEPKLPAALALAFWPMDQSLDQTAPTDNSELIDLFGRAHFGALWDYQKPDPSDDSSNQPNTTT